MVDYIQGSVFDRLKVVRMSHLRIKYIELLSEKGIENSEYRSEKLQARLLKAFGNKLSFWLSKHRSQAELICYDNVPKGQIVKAGVMQ